MKNKRRNSIGYKKLNFNVKLYSVVLLMLLSFLTVFTESYAQSNKNEILTPKEINDYKLYSDERWAGLIPYKSKGKWGFLDHDGKIAIAAKYQAIKLPKYYRG